MYRTSYSNQDTVGRLKYWREGIVQGYQCMKGLITCFPRYKADPLRLD